MVQTFSFKPAKLTGRTTVEVDRRWVRATTPKGQVHIDFNLVETIRYWVTESRGAAITGHLVIKDGQGRKLALQCSGFGMDTDMVEFLRAASATLAAVGEVRPDLRVAPEPTVSHRRLMASIIIAAVVIIPISYYMITEWMGNFAYQTDLNYFTFGIVAVLALVFAFLTVAFHSLKTARTNPVDSLKYE